jgi:Cu(I)/Ag(I) efflux system membrane fusion protein
LSDTEDNPRGPIWVAVLAAVGVLLAVWLGHFLLTRGAGEGVTAEQGELQMRSRLEPDPPRQQDERLHVQVTKGTKPLGEGSLSLRYVMPAMGSMPEMSGKATVESRGPGAYVATFSVPMAGTWTLEASFTSPEGSITATYSMTPGRKGLTLVSTGGAGMAGGGTGAGPSTIYVSPERRQLIGLRTAPVEVREVEHRIRTVARVTYNEALLSDFSLQVRGWVGKLFVDKTGQLVKANQELFTLYSPQIYAAEQELLSLAGTGGAGSRAGDAALKAARRRLSLWEVSPAFIERVEKTGRAEEYVPIASPAAGYVVEKNIVAGAGVEPGKVLYRIAGLDSVWLMAELYEADLELVQAGQAVTVTLPYQPAARYEAKIDYVYPYLQSETRTGSARIVLSNPGLALKPAMYANIELAIPRGERLVVPEPAVIYAGVHRYVFVDLGDGRLELRQIQIGLSDGDDDEVISGLKAGDIVVVSGNFLISSESRLKSAAEQW